MFGILRLIMSETERFTTSEMGSLGSGADGDPAPDDGGGGRAQPGAGARQPRGAGPAPHRAPRRAPDGAIVTVMCMVVGLVFAGGTILFTALPNVARELTATQTSALWMADVYPLVIAALLMPAGALIDRYGRKRGAVVGLILIGAFFFAAGQADSAGTVILFLGLAGIGGALAFPATLATITAIMPKQRRGTAVGMWAASMLLGGTIGAGAGGALSQYASTTWVFTAMAIVAAVLLAATLTFVPESRDERVIHVDVVGSLLSIGGVGLFVLGMIEAPSKGWTHPLTMSALLGVAFLIAFVRWELHTDKPLFDVRLLLDGRFGTGSLVNVLSWFYAFGTFFNGVQYRAFGLGYGPVKTGLSLVSMAILTVPMGLLGPRWARRYGARVVMAGGLAMMAVGSIAGALAATTQTYHWVALAEIIAFGGLGLVGGPATEAIVDALPDSHQGVASAINDTTRELGVAVGIALLGSTFNLAYRHSINDNPNGLPDAALDITRDSPIAGLHLASGLPPDTAAAQVDLVHHSVATGLSLAWAAGAVILALGAVAVMLTHPHDNPRSRTGPAAEPRSVGPRRTQASHPGRVPRRR